MNRKQMLPYFAGQALIGLLQIHGPDIVKGRGGMTYEKIAKEAFALAKEMIKQVPEEEN